jgi:FMN-dependent NADH-azoreductase
VTRNLLHISASPRDTQSQSRRAGKQFVARLRQQRDIDVTRRDLGTEPPPILDAAFMNANLAREESRSAADRAALAYSEMLLAELIAADFIVIDMPMHNFTVPAVLKTWIDYVVRPHRSFGFSLEGKVPWLKDRPVRIITACGGRFTGPYPQQDFLTPYLRYVFGVIGLRDLEFLLLEQMTRPEGQAAAVGLVAEWTEQQLQTLTFS